MDFRTAVFKRAHEMAKQTGKNFAICLVRAWEVYRLKKAMLKGKVKFAYEKADGSLRYALGTLTGNLGIKGTGKANYKTLAYLAGSLPDKLFVETANIARALFNIGIENASQDEEEEIMAAFTDPIGYDQLTVTEKAEVIYRKLEILSRIGNLQIK